MQNVMLNGIANQVIGCNIGRHTHVCHMLLDNTHMLTRSVSVFAYIV